MRPAAIDRLVAKGEDRIHAVVARLSPAAALGIRHDFGNWAHDSQKEPPGWWQRWVIMGGRGFGKTRAGAEWIAAQARADSDLRIALVAATREEARAIMIEGESGLISVAGHEIVEWKPSLHRLVFINGAEAMLFSGANPDKLRGFQHHIAWCDELAKWRHAQETWDMLQLGLRLGKRPRALITTTPGSAEALGTTILEMKGTVLSRGRTRENHFLSEDFMETVHRIYRGTRLEKQELDGELLPDGRFALWTAELIASCRVQVSDWGPIARQRVESACDGQPASARSAGCLGDIRAPERGDRTDVTDLRRDGPQLPRFTKLHIGVDPPIEDGTCGIVACAMTQDHAGIKTGYVLADHSVTGRSPEGWARAVADAVRTHESATGLSVKVVAERNQGGRMVEANLRAADSGLRVKLVHAREGKVARAEPIAHLFEAGRVKLAGHFPELEAELRQFKAGGGQQKRRWFGPDGRASSPDRADAMVWALTDLLLTKETAQPRVRRL